RYDLSVLPLTYRGGSRSHNNVQTPKTALHTMQGKTFSVAFRGAVQLLPSSHGQCGGGVQGLPFPRGELPPPGKNHVHDGLYGGSEDAVPQVQIHKRRRTQGGDFDVSEVPLLGI